MGFEDFMEDALTCPICGAAPAVLDKDSIRLTETMLSLVASCVDADCHTVWLAAAHRSEEE